MIGDGYFPAKQRTPPQTPLLAIQFGAATIYDLPKHKWTCWMAALTCNFHVFPSCVTTGIAAVFFSIRYIAQAWYVRAFPAFLICHFDSFPSSSLFQFLDVVPFAVRTVSLRGSSTPWTFCGYVIATECMHISKLQFATRVWICKRLSLANKKRKGFECRQVDSASIFGRPQGAAAVLIRGTRINSPGLCS